MKIHNSISLCTKKDAYVWSYASDRIVKYIDAEHYTLIVPSQQVDLFKRISNPKFDVVDEQRFAPEFSLQSVKNAMPEHKKGRAGWYYQQLLKIKALSQSKCNTDINLIWDADTIPLGKIDFIHNNKLVYYMGSEHHKPYFLYTKKLIDLEKLVGFSFIAQSFTAKSVWVNEFLAMLSNKFQMSWFDAILSNIDFEENSGFSEYETLGTYFVKNYADEMLICRKNWHRKGHEICHIEDLDLYEICRILNKPLFVCYETYHYSTNEQRLIKDTNDDDMIVSVIENKKQSQKWRRYEYFSQTQRDGEEIKSFKKTLDSDLSVDASQAYQPISSALI